MYTAVENLNSQLLMAVSPALRIELAGDFLCSVSLVPLMSDLFE